MMAQQPHSCLVSHKSMEKIAVGRGGQGTQK